MSPESPVAFPESLLSLPAWPPPVAALRGPVWPMSASSAEFAGCGAAPLVTIGGTIGFRPDVVNCDAIKRTPISPAAPNPINRQVLDERGGSCAAICDSRDGVFWLLGVRTSGAATRGTTLVDALVAAAGISVAGLAPPLGSQLVGGPARLAIPRRARRNSTWSPPPIQLLRSAVWI